MLNNNFQAVLDHIRSIAGTPAETGKQFERLIKTYLLQDPLYQERFSNVWLWTEWLERRSDFSGSDFGIDLVAEERDGGYCAIQCKCHAAGTRLSKGDLDKFISASNRDPFTARIFVDTGAEWGAKAKKTIHGLKPPCAVMRFGDLASRPVNWPDLVRGYPEDLTFPHDPFRLRPHQQDALNAVINGFAECDRGKLIMACGTGKTFTALRIAEKLAGMGGCVLYLVPSISLFQQSMREWAEQKEIPHRYVGICSDTRAGRSDEDASLEELEIPVTTEPEAILQSLREVHPNALTVVFCTYQSLRLIQDAQADGAVPFDLILCDEAHRTTGVERPGDPTSPFVLVHDEERIKAQKRLYMTATPRLYTERARQKAAKHSIEVFSMDDTATYGEEFLRLPFSRAVELDLLSDYKVIIFGVSESDSTDALVAHLTSEKQSDVNITDAAKIVGCWRALQNPENHDVTESPPRPLQRAIAFTSTIPSSKRLARFWNSVVEKAVGSLPEEERGTNFLCETRHVDGKHNALERKACIEWLKGATDGACRIVSNARCLSEGIDVPALDAVLFMSPRNSYIDIVQAVGRVMRKSPGKKNGYIVLPVAIPEGVDSAAALNNNTRFATVWAVLRALRSHDDRLDAEINQMDLNKKLPKRFILGGDGAGGGEQDLPFPPMVLPPGAIYAKIVEKCGDRKYWETWAKDVADIFSRLTVRIEDLLDRGDDILSEWFADFEKELKGLINDTITRKDAVEMMAQHILTQPVFNALFENYEFAKGNPVAQALDRLRGDFQEFGLENETRDLEPFYESVRQRAQGLDSPEARQRVLMELYEQFFAKAMARDAARLGIVYTPVEIVDFILNSAQAVLQEEFGRDLGDEGVHILDPFTGTGTFLVRLLQSELIEDVDLQRKFRTELHANEIVLLAYYIAAIHIEEAFHGRKGPESAYEPFQGIVLTDTFNLNTDRTGFPRDWLPVNSERMERQQKSQIQVIVGNPPWRGGQESSADNNPNVEYPDLEQRIGDTYTARSTSTLKSGLYNSYKLALRWASDRLGEQGVVAFVTSGSWLDGNADSGVRACLAEEFDSVHVFNLRGNARTQGEIRRREGDNVFDQGSRAPVAVVLLVRNQSAQHKGCRIRYRDIGNNLNRKEKLSIVREAGSIKGIEEWQEVTPDEHNDWIGHRDPAFQAFYPMGSKAAKAGRVDDPVFKLFSNGYKTSRDAYLYNFSRVNCANECPQSS